MLREGYESREKRYIEEMSDRTCLKNKKTFYKTKKKKKNDKQ